jgi:hypothetical protein
MCPMSIKQQTEVALVGEPSDYMIRDSREHEWIKAALFAFCVKYFLYFSMVGATENDGQLKSFSV